MTIDKRIDTHNRMREHLQHDNANSSHSLLIRQILLVDSSRNRGGSVIVEVEMELTIACAEFELLEEQGVIVKCESVEDVEFRLMRSENVRAQSFRERKK